MGLEAANDNERGRAMPELSMADAIAEIGLLRQQVSQEGATDSEPDELSRILIDVRNEKISPADGVAKAKKLVESRSTYH